MVHSCPERNLRTTHQGSNCKLSIVDVIRDNLLIRRNKTFSQLRVVRVSLNSHVFDFLLSSRIKESVNLHQELDLSHFKGLVTSAKYLFRFNGPTVSVQVFRA